MTQWLTLSINMGHTRPRALIIQEMLLNNSIDNLVECHKLVSELELVLAKIYICLSL